MSAMLRFAGLVLCTTVLAAAEAGTPDPNAAPALPSPEAQPFPSQSAVVEIIKPSTWRTWMPQAIADPLLPTTGLVTAEVERWSEKQIKEQVDAQAVRLQDWLVTKASPSAGFLTWLEAHPALRRDFLLALDWQYDDTAAAVQVLDALRQEFPKQVEKLGHLAIAIAVVWDQPDAITSSRHWCIWGMETSQFPALLQARDVFAWFADERNQTRFVFKPSQLPWPLMVHLVDIDVSPAEMTWALGKSSLAKDIAALYPSVPYDRAKLNTRQATLGDRAYSLQNLLSIGGVCGDQAHYASRMAKIFGVPAMKVAGEGRFGGAGHAWSGYLVASKGRPILEFTGRYFFDYYYTGEVFDPQTRTFTLDRHVALGYDGISLSFVSAQQAALLARLAVGNMAADPQLAIALARKAIDRNRYDADAWRVLTQLGGDGAMPRKDFDGLLTRMLKDLAAHPDITFEGVMRAQRCLPRDDLKARQGLWNAAFALYGQRPDLQIQLRMRQCAELGEAGKGIEATELALQTVIANAKEGSLVMPLVSHVVEVSLRYAVELKNFRMSFVKAQLAKADNDFPKQRGSAPSPVYQEFRREIGRLP